MSPEMSGDARREDSEASSWSRRWLVHGDLLAEQAQLNAGPAPDPFGAEVAEGLRSGIDVRLVAVEDAIGGGEDLVGDGDHGLLVAAAAADLAYRSERWVLLRRAARRPDPMSALRSHVEPRLPADSRWPGHMPAHEAR
jgi:hypothetical protein